MFELRHIDMKFPVCQVKNVAVIAASVRNLSHENKTFECVARRAESKTLERHLYIRPE